MEFYQILIVIIVSALAIRFSFKFDLNRFLENRRKIKLDQLKNICPHMRISHHKDNEFAMQSYFSKPRGTFNWICSQCGCVVDSQEEVDRLMEPYKKNPNLYLKKHKSFFKKAKKLKLTE